MKCSVCHNIPRVFLTLGGGYWHRTRDGEMLCPGCWHWAYWIMGVRWGSA